MRCAPCTSHFYKGNDPKKTKKAIAPMARRPRALFIPMRSPRNTRVHTRSVSRHTPHMHVCICMCKKGKKEVGGWVSA